MKKYYDFINEAKKLEENPLIQSAKRGGSSSVKKYIKSGEYDINDRDSYQRTALMWSCLNKFLMVSKILIDAGADVNLVDKDHRTALMMSYTPKTIKLLLDNGADVNIKNNNGDNVAMSWLTYYTNNPEKLLEYLKLFIVHGLNLDYVNPRNNMNFYEKLREIYKDSNVIQEYMDENYPQYKEEYELKQNVNKFNL